MFTGGSQDRSKRFLESTVLTNASADDKVMQEDIFGPVLPVLTYDNPDKAIAFIKSKPKPLALYLFSESSTLRKKGLREVSFGGGSTNEVLMYFSNDHLPFGGVGSSGMGNYHGEAGFKTFSHFKSFIQKPTLFEFPFKYFPHANWKFAMIKRAMGL